MRSISFVIPIEPAAKERVRFGNGKVFTAPATRAYERAIALWVRQAYRGKPDDGPIRLTAKFIVKRPRRPKFKSGPAVRPDLDNYLKALMDALNGILWVDDAQVCEYGPGTGKYYDCTGLGPRIEMKVEILTSLTPIS